MNKLEYVGQLGRHFGLRWLVYRLGYAARLRVGVLRRQLPATNWADQPLRNLLGDPALAEAEAYLAYRRSRAPAFFFASSRRQAYQPYFAGWDEGTSPPVHLSKLVARGLLRYFEHTPVQVGFPPDWHADPFSGRRAPADRHWSQIDDFEHGDIKIIWEPSRFGWVYGLVRAYWRTGDERYARLFWQLVEDWRAHNQPQRGPNWKCGQEISFRVMACCFGLYGFLDAQATDAERVASLAQMMAISGRRIEANIQHALSQRNNHGISEAVGLWTIGLLFPDLRLAARWSEKGRQLLERLGRELIYADGSFVQHSVNYHRLMLHDYVWALRLADVHGRPFSTELKERVGQASAWLYQIQDAASGRVPYYGQNDGALILPLNNCDYQDFRPVIQAAHYSTTGARCYDSGAWDEDLLWLFGPEAVRASVAAPHRTDLAARVGGYYTLRSKTGFAFVRCASFQHRPGQADMLHVDLWWRGQNIALDAGTYSYNAAPPWNNPLSHTAYHNTVTVDGLDQMDRRGMFVWLPWLRSRLRSCQRSQAGHLAYWEGEHAGYQRLEVPVVHRRGIVRLGDEEWLVVDRLSSRGEHDYRLQWLFPDVPYEWDGCTGRLTLHMPVAPYWVEMATLRGEAVYSLVRADEQGPRGWRAPYYNHREPALSVAVVARAKSSLFWTMLGPSPVQIVVEGQGMRVQAERWQGWVCFQADDEGPGALIASMGVEGDIHDQLEVR